MGDKSLPLATWRGRGPQSFGSAPPPPHQPSPGGSASATPPQGGSDMRCIRRSSITPPGRREGAARSRAGGGTNTPPRRISLARAEKPWRRRSSVCGIPAGLMAHTLPIAWDIYRAGINYGCVSHFLLAGPPPGRAYHSRKNGRSLMKMNHEWTRINTKTDGPPSTTCGTKMLLQFCALGVPLTSCPCWIGETPLDKPSCISCPDVNQGSTHDRPRDQTPGIVEGRFLMVDWR